MDVLRAPRSPRRRWRWLAAAAGILVVVGVTIALRFAAPAAPSVPATTLWIGEVRRGEMVRQVQGRGVLVPEHVEWVTATTPARVARILVKPGTVVEAETVLVELQNGELELAALDAERAAAAAEAELVQLDVGYRTRLLDQEGALATLRADHAAVTRRAGAAEELARSGLVSTLDRLDVADRSDGIATRLAVEEKRLGVLDYGMRSQLVSQSAQVKKLREVASFRRRELESLRVRAGVAGLLQELPLESGQWVTTGTLIAKVARPDRLKAVLQVPEALVEDVRPGQSVDLDVQGTSCAGEVSRIDPAVLGGTVRVEVVLAAAPPTGARADLSVSATIEIERLENVLVMQRPAGAQPDVSYSLFRVEPDERGARRVQVRLGRGSVREIEVKSGLEAGDRVILSDTARHDEHERIRID